MKPGLLVLAGGAEFGDGMEAADRRAIERAGGFDAPICILPTAAAPDNNHLRAGGNGMRWFKSLGARNVTLLNVIDPASANDETLAASVRTSRLIYMLGGFPRHLGETLKGSACWRAALDAYNEGAVIAGSSAGAMVLCEQYYDPYERKLLPGLNLVSKACVIPHHNRSGIGWVEQFRHLLPQATLIGIDESTALIGEPGGTWQVYGPGEVTVYGRQAERHAHGASFFLSSEV